jgi:hypothetical protein
MGSEKLCDFPIVRLRIPRTAKMKRVYLASGKESCLRFSYSIVGGNIFAYVRSRGEDLLAHRGNLITARCEVWRRNLFGGDNDLYLEFHPTAESPTHEVHVIGGNVVPRRLQVPGSRLIRACAPKKGAVVLIPLHL